MSETKVRQFGNHPITCDRSKLFDNDIAHFSILLQKRPAFTKKKDHCETELKLQRHSYVQCEHLRAALIFEPRSTHHALQSARSRFDSSADQENKPYHSAELIFLAGARGIEPRSKVLETFILTVVLCPYGGTGMIIPLVRRFSNGIHEMSEVYY